MFERRFGILLPSPACARPRVPKLFGRDGTGDAEVKKSKIGIGKVKNGAASKPLPREIEDGVGADPRPCRRLLWLPETISGDEVVSGNRKLDVAIPSCRHGKVKNGLACPAA